MATPVVGILTLSEAEYLDDSVGASELEWTLPSGREGVPVAFVAKGYGEPGGQHVMAVGRALTRSRRATRDGRWTYWHCDDVMWLKRPLYQVDFTQAESAAVGTLGGFASYRLQGIGAGIRSRDSWNAFIGVLKRLNRRVNLNRFLV